MKYLELATGKAVQASKGYMCNHGGVVVRQPDVWVVLGGDGMTLRSEEGFKRDYESVVDVLEKPQEPAIKWSREGDAYCVGEFPNRVFLHKTEADALYKFMCEKQRLRGMA